MRKYLRKYFILTICSAGLPCNREVLVGGCCRYDTGTSGCPYHNKKMGIFLKGKYPNEFYLIDTVKKIS